MLHVGTLRDEVREGSVPVIVGIDALHFLKGQVALSVGRHEDAPGEAASLRDEEHAAFVAGAQLLNRLVYLQKVLMREGLIDRDVVVAPREMRRGTRLLTGSRAARDAVHVDVATDDASLQSGQHGELYASGKATGVCYTGSPVNDFTVRLG